MAEANFTDDAFETYAERVEHTRDSTPELDRANTRRRLVDPFLELLGWPLTMPEGDVYVDVEYSITDNEYVDYALVEDDDVHAFVVAIPFDEELDEDDRDRAVTLLNAETVDWVILTNGDKVELHYRDEDEGVLFLQTDAESLGDDRQRLDVVTCDSFVSGRATEVASEHAALGDALEVLGSSKEDIVDDVVEVVEENLGMSTLNVRYLAEEYVEGVETHLDNRRDDLLNPESDDEDDDEDSDEGDDEGNQNDGGENTETADGSEDGEAGHSEDTVTQDEDADDEGEEVDRNDTDTAEARMLSQYLSTVVQRDAGLAIEDGDFRPASGQTMMEGTRDAIASLIRRRYLRQDALPVTTDEVGRGVLNSSDDLPDGGKMEDPVELGGGLYLNTNDEAALSAILQSTISASVENERKRSKLPWISRNELEGDVDDTVAIYPADPDVADGLDDGFGAWGGIVIDREPDWFALYVREPVGEVRYVGRVEDVVPVEEFGFENLEDYDWYEPDGPQKYMIRFTETYRLCTPLSVSEDSSGWNNGINYTKLQDFKSSDYIDNLNT